MKCSEALTMLSAMVDGETSLVQPRELRAHLEGCPSCRASHTQAVTIDRVLRSEVSVPEGLAERMIRRNQGTSLPTQRILEKRTMILRRTLTATAVLAIATFGLLRLATPSAQAAYDRMHEAFQNADGIKIRMVRSLPAPSVVRTMWMQGGAIRIEESGKPAVIVREGFQFQKGANGIDRSASNWGPKEVLAILDFRNVRATQESEAPNRVRLIGADRATVERLVRLQIEPEELVDWATRMSVWVDTRTNLPIRAVREAYVDDRWQVQLEMAFEYAIRIEPSMFDPKSLEKAK